MSFTPINKINLNLDNSNTNQKDSVYNSNTENMKNNSNFLIENINQNNDNTKNNSFFPNKNYIFNNLINSNDLNQNKLVEQTLNKTEISEYQINENKVKFEEIIANMSNYMNQYIYMGFFQNALFYAEKIFFLTLKREEAIGNFISINNPNLLYNPIYQLNEQLYNFANCLYLNKEYFRCVNLIQKYNMTYYNIKFLILLGQALFASEDYESLIQFLDKPSFEFIESNLKFNS